MENARPTKPPLRRAAGATVPDRVPAASARTAGPAAGSRCTITALTHQQRGGEIGTAMIAVRLPMPSATPLAPAPRVYPTLRAARRRASATHPDLAREHRDPVDVARRVARRGHRRAARAPHEHDEAADQRPARYSAASTRGERPQPPGADPVGEAADRDRQQQCEHADADMPRPTWAPDSPTIWVKKTAVPVRNEPVAKAERMHCRASWRSSLVGGITPAGSRIRTTLGDHRTAPRADISPVVRR